MITLYLSQFKDNITMYW